MKKLHKTTSEKHINKRRPSGLRSINIQYDVYGYAAASVLFSQGNTKVLCSVTLHQSVPYFLRGKGTGWLTAEYAMLPNSTHQRTIRDSSSAQKNARSSEISRIIGRCLRTTIDFKSLGEHTIYVDCDVLQADGGTRVACITASSLALKEACNRWYNQKILYKNVFKESIYAISAGIVNETLCIDLSYEEDSNADADFNFIFTESENILEIQGTAEKKALPWQTFEQLKDLALHGITFIKNVCKETSPQSKIITSPMASVQPKKKQLKAPFFSLGNRINHK